ncbi:MAG: DUF547 domain-containing protein [Fulvivirga sp.]
MKTSFFTFLLSTALLINANASVSTFNAKTDKFFNRYVNNGMVAYKAIKSNLSEVAGLYAEIESMDLSSASDNEEKAFYINAYNVVVIYQVTKFYPLKSALDQSGFFDKVKHKVAGESLTLNHLEIKKLIIPYQDPRIHFVLACAAKSCPPLASFAYTADQIDKQLEARTMLAINDAGWMKVDASENKVLVSKIFDWYKKDFTATGMSLLEFINKYRNKKIPNNYSVGYYEYDWSLNEG